MSKSGFNLSLICACGVAIAMSVLIGACSGTQNIDTGDPKTIARMDHAMVEYASLDSAGRDSVRHVYDAPLSLLFAIGGRGEVTDSAVCVYSASRGVRMFTAAVDSLLPDLDSVQSVLGIVDGRFASLLPKARIDSIYAVVSPYNQSIFTSGSMMLVGLNHYFGAGFDGYSNFEPYQRLNKRVGQLPYDMVEAAVASAYPMVDMQEGTVLQHLLYQGALIEAKMQLVPDATEAEALGYTPAQYEWMVANEAPAWDALISRNLLYSTSATDAERLIRPSPATTILHPASPGRAGRYIGHRIVRSYLESHPDTSLEYLLSPGFYAGQQTLVDASYAP